MGRLDSLAREGLEFFEQRTTPDLRDITALKDGRPEWLYDLVREAHDGMLPDDWRYDTIHSALDAIAGEDADYADYLDDAGHEFADTNVDTYTGDRLAWLGSHLARSGYVDVGCEELAVDPDTGIIERIAYGQYVESREVWGLVTRALEDVADGYGGDGLGDDEEATA